MATALDTVRRALRLLGVTQEGEQPNAEQTADGIIALKAMLGTWEGLGLSLGPSVGFDFEAGDTLPFPATHDDALAFNLAVNIAAEYGQQIPPAVGARASETFAVLQGQYADLQTMACDFGLVRGGRASWGLR